MSGLVTNHRKQVFSWHGSDILCTNKPKGQCSFRRTWPRSSLDSHCWLLTSLPKTEDSCTLENVEALSETIDVIVLLRLLARETKSKWASSWDYGTYHIGNQRRLRRARAFAVRTHEVQKYPTGWLHMWVWKMSLWRIKSTIISWAGSNVNDCHSPTLKNIEEVAGMKDKSSLATYVLSHLKNFFSFFSSVCGCVQWSPRTLPNIMIGDLWSTIIISEDITVNRHWYPLGHDYDQSETFVHDWGQNYHYIMTVLEKHQYNGVTHFCYFQVNGGAFK